MALLKTSKKVNVHPSRLIKDSSQEDLSTAR